MTITPLPHEITGNKQSTQLIVFLHGWPDTLAVWDKVIPSLEQNHYILNVTYPNYSTKEKKPRGISFEETIDRLKATIELVNDTKRSIILVGHDWGAFYAYYIDFLNPKYVSEIIALDVGAYVPIKNPFFVSFLVLYQFFLIVALFIGGAIGKFITKAIIKLNMYSPPWMNRVDASWNYPYYQLWKKLLTNKFSVIPNYKPSVPVVYVNGKKKPISIHNDSWIKFLKENPRCEFHDEPFIHWVQLEMPEFLTDLIKRRARLLLNQPKN